MEPNRAARRYFSLLLPVMLVFLAASLAIDWLDDNMSPPRELLAVLALVPIAALLSMFWVQWRYILDLDEYLRQLHVKAVLLAAALSLGLGTGWGYLERAIEVPPLDVYWLNPVFWVAYALAVTAFTAREAVSSK